MTAEPRDVEDWCGSPVAHEPHPGCSGWPSVEARDFIATAEILAEPYNETIAALEARLAAADRENAELRREVETGRAEWTRAVVERYALAGERDGLRLAVEEIRGKYRQATAERDDLRAQLAAAQAQLAEARDMHASAIERHIGLGMAVWQAIADARPLVEVVDLIGDDFNAVDAVDDEAIVLFTKARDAALSAAPQPEPEDGCAECTESGTRNCVAGCKPEPPASDEPALDLMTALRDSLEVAKGGGTFADWNCPPPTPECRHCNGSGNAHTAEGADVGICGTCHGTGSAAGGGL